MENKIPKTLCKSILPAALAVVMIVAGIFLTGCKSEGSDTASLDGAVAISGAVTNTSGAPAAGVIVQIVGLRENNKIEYIGEATSDKSGNYSVRISPADLFPTDGENADAAGASGGSIAPMDTGAGENAGASGSAGAASDGSISPADASAGGNTGGENTGASDNAGGASDSNAANTENAGEGAAGDTAANAGASPLSGKFGIVTKAADAALEDIDVYYAGGIVKDGKVVPFEAPSESAAFTGQIFSAEIDQTEITGCDIIVAGIDPEPLTITGTITDKNGKGLEGIVVTALEAPDSPLGIHSRTTSNADGSYTIDLSEVWGSILAPYKPPGTPGGPPLPEDSATASESGSAPAGEGEYFEVPDGPPGFDDVDTSGASGPGSDAAATDTSQPPMEGGLDELPDNPASSAGESPSDADTPASTQEGEDDEDSDEDAGNAVDIHLYFQLLWRIQLGEEFSFIVSFGEDSAFGQYYYRDTPTSGIDWAKYKTLLADEQNMFLESVGVTEIILSKDVTRVTGIDQKFSDAK
jgi:hypothetical protein